MNKKAKFLIPTVIIATNMLLAGLAPAQTFSNLYTFTGGADGGTAYAGLTEGSDGNFYGTTEYGGLQDGGTVFRISKDGNLTTLFSFNNGEYFASGLVLGGDGKFYGTAGLIAGTPGGSVFKIDTNGTFTPLHSFTGGTPNGKLALGRDGFFYGTTQTDTTHGTIFKISASGALTTLRSFSDNTGGSLNGGLVQGTDGNFYGTTYSGGSNQVGSIFKISTAGSFAIVYSFKFDEGYTPAAGLIQGSDGNLYGTTESGGSGDIRYGTVFKISTNGVLSYLHTFNRDAGWQLLASLLQGNNGDFYGTTSIGESNTYGNATGGSIFKISDSGKFTTLYRFSGGDDGSYSSAGLVQDGNGKFYGTTEYGGSSGAGTVFVLTLPSPPLLTISPAEAGVNLSWPTNVDGYPFTLQSTTDLNPSTVWTSVSQDSAIFSGQNVVTNPLSNTQQFYRLSQ